jgi:hypothetical protein
VAQLKGCAKTKIDNECISLILSKLKGHFHVFSSMFYSIMDAHGDEFKIPYFDILYERLIKGKYKIMQLDTLFGSKNRDLMAHTSKGKHET